ncbi:hypothetical protein [Gemmobacter nectariphilus]|uniref:hypothetical protein n=1 Tax=Gemmobacter nectariphilus TaxID=220343 RepID=UPI0012B64490|nr:hypothetical protein [Gemmobacter nectariphilus]
MKLRSLSVGWLFNYLRWHFSLENPNDGTAAWQSQQAGKAAGRGNRREKLAGSARDRVKTGRRAAHQVASNRGTDGLQGNIVYQ